MTSKELNPFIFKSLTSFVDLYQSTPSEENNLDLIRGGKRRSEITAAALYSAVTIDTSIKETEKYAFELLAQRTSNFLWPERAYCPTDESSPYWGTVPTSFAIIAIAKFLAKHPKATVLEELIKSCDALFEIEENGYFRKAGINRSDVHNTNLLGAYGLFTVAQLLPTGSVRARMYQESSRRSILKVLMHQSPQGFFPYHQLTLTCPILYQAMVVAQLKVFLYEMPNAVLEKAYKSGVQALETFFDKSGNIHWERANSHDKSGANWAYSFSYCALLDLNNDLASKVLGKLERFCSNGLFQGVEDDSSTQNDSFYSSWIIYGLIWSQNSSMRISPSENLMTAKWLLLKAHYFFGKFQFALKYLKNRYLNFLYDSGALENRKWGG